MGDVIHVNTRTQDRPTIIVGTIVGELLADPSNGEGEVVIAPKFVEYNYHLQVDLLNDWIGLLSRYLEDIEEADKELDDG